MKASSYWARAAAVIALLAMAGDVRSEEPAKGVLSYINEMGVRTLEVVGPEAQGSRVEGVARVLLQGLDIEQLARFTMGRFYRSASEQQRSEYTRLFAAHVVDLFVERLGDRSVDRFEVTKTELLPDGDVIVTTDIHRVDSTPVTAGWRVRPATESYKVVDIIVEGQSMAMYFRGLNEDWMSKMQVTGMLTKLRSLTERTGSGSVVAQLVDSR